MTNAIGATIGKRYSGLRDVIAVAILLLAIAPPGTNAATETNDSGSNGIVEGAVVSAETGRAVPAAFDRAGGELLYYHLQKNQHRGGARAMIADLEFTEARGPSVGIGLGLGRIALDFSRIFFDTSNFDEPVYITLRADI